MGGEAAGCLAPATALAAVLAAVGAAVVGTVGAVGRMRPGTAIAWVAALLGVVTLCVLLYRPLSDRASYADGPAGIPRDRLFRVRVPPRGGWLRRFLEPGAAGFLGAEDDALLLRLRDVTNYPIACFWSLLAADRFGILPPWAGPWLVGGSVLLTLAWTVASLPLRERRIPWDRVRSVARSGHRFHFDADLEGFPEGVVLDPGPFAADRLAALLAERTRLLDHATGEPVTLSTIRR
jgi:hypothetical protein